jgi:hypothetical protein
MHGHEGGLAFALHGRVQRVAFDVDDAHGRIEDPRSGSPHDAHEGARRVVRRCPCVGRTVSCAHQRWAGGST